jgi:CRP-like cAMP-binding protein
MQRVGEVLANHLACLGELSARDREALEALPADIRELPRLKDTLRRGDHPKEVVVVLSGLLYRYTIGAEGRRQIHSFYLPREAPCLETLYIDYMDNNLGAVVNSVCGFIPHGALYEVIDRFEGARKLLWRQTLVQGAVFREWLVRNSNFPAHASLAHFLCEMFTRAKAAKLVENDSCDLPLTQEFVADALGLTSVHLNRTLQLLRDAGAVEWRSGRLTVRDLPRLEDIASFDPTYLHLRCG